MADTYTTSNRLEKMEPGQYLDTWGARMNAQGGSDLVDAALDGVEDFALSGALTLTNNNGASDQARKRGLNITGGTGGTITIPNVDKLYFVRNGSSGDVVITTGSGTTATIKTGLGKWVMCDGSNNVYQASGPDFGSANIVTTGAATLGATSATTLSTSGQASLASASVTGALALTTATVTNSANTGNLEITNSNASLSNAVVRQNIYRAANAAYSFFSCSSGNFADVEFSVNGVGTVSSDGGTAMSTPADYADMMEWADGNPDSEDRVGHSVVLEGDKVRKASEDDDPEDVIGIASGNPSVCGGAGWNRWSGKFLTDDFNRTILDDNGDRVLSEFYDPAADYTPRAARAEWDPIGLCGRISMRKGCPTNPRWRKMRDVSATVEEWLVR